MDTLLYLRNMLLGLALVISTESVAQSDQFLEGFMDFPLLDGVTEVEDPGRFVFDTPGGTVAETSLLPSKKIEQIIKLYQENLPAFGWSCRQVNESLMCEREQSLLTLSPFKNEKYGPLIRVRLEPNLEPNNGGET